MSADRSETKTFCPRKRAAVGARPASRGESPQIIELSSERAPDPELVRKVGVRLDALGWIVGIAGAIVVYISIGFLIPIFIDPDERWSLAAQNAPLIAGYLLVDGLLVTRWLRARRRVALAWIAEGRAPDEREHRRTLGMALYGTKKVALGWAFAAVLFFALATVMHSWQFGIVVAATIWLGGETASALIYLGSERILRPVTACALAARQPPGATAPGVRLRFLMAWALGTGVPLLGVLVVTGVGVFRPEVETQYIAAAALFLGGVAVVSGLVATLFAAKAIADPVTSVRTGLERIARGELDAVVPVDDGSEIGQLQAGFNRMTEGLRERELIRDLFGRQVGEDVARAALRDGTRLGGEEREIGALFVDILGSTSMAMAMPPTEVVRTLNRFFRVVVEVVQSEGGVVNKFEGDAALCVFGAPVPGPDPAGAALRTARTLAGRLTRDVPEVDYGIGISAGIAVAGNVGAEQRFEYTVIGDPVNEAARLSDLAKQRPERIMASAAALDRAGQAEVDAWRVTESAVLRGRTAATQIAHPRAEL